MQLQSAKKYLSSKRSLGIFSWFIGKAQSINGWAVIGEHLTIAVAVILVAHYLGIWVESTFG